MRSGRFRLAGLSLVSLVLLAFAPAAHACDRGASNPADQPPFGGEPLLPASQPVAGTRPIAGSTLTPEQARRLAAAAVGSSSAQRAVIRTLVDGSTREWRVDFYDADGTHSGQVLINDAQRCVIEHWTGSAVDTKLARGYRGAVSGKVNRWWIWLPLCVLFIAPFIDPRRPLRMLHMDLLALLAFSVSLFFFNKAKIELSVALVYPVLAYVFARMLIAGFRPTPEGRERLIPLAPRGLLVAGIAALVVFHTVYIATEG